MRNYWLKGNLVMALVVWMVCLGILPQNALALPSQSLAVVELGSTRQAYTKEIMRVLSSPEAKLQLLAAGIRQEDVKDALDRLDDAQLAALSERAEAVKTGGSGVGIVIAILVIVLLIVLIVNLMDKRIEIKDARR